MHEETTVKTAVGLGAAALMAIATAVAFAHRTPPPLAPTKLGVESSHFNALSLAGDRLLAAGAMGEILYTDDQGAKWNLAKLDQDRQALLVDVEFAADKKTGFAVGHEGWILRTQDGGSSWQEMAFDAKNGEPLMSISRLPSGHWATVGAFGRAMVTKDEGKTWERMELPAEVEDKHMNRIAHSADGQHWMIVGERGLVLQSHDGGVSWVVEPPFYNGSFYNIMPMDNGGWLVYGMRGNIFLKANADAPWTQSSLNAPVSFYGHTRTQDGSIVLAGQGGMLAISRDNGKSFTLQKVNGRSSLTDVVQNAQGKGWIASAAGIQSLPVLQKIEPSTSQGVAQ